MSAAEQTPNILPTIYSVPAAFITQDDLAALAPALVHDNCTAGALYNELMSGHSMLWRLEAPDAAAVAVTSIQDTPSGREFRIWLLAGNGPHKYWELCFGAFLDVAKKTKCARVVTQTTQSLAEYYVKLADFKIEGVVISKELEDG